MGFTSGSNYGEGDDWSGDYSWDGWDYGFLSDGGGGWWDNFDSSGDYMTGDYDPGSWDEFYGYWLDNGLTPSEAAAMADYETGTIHIDTSEPGSLPHVPLDLPGVIPASYDPGSIPTPDLFAYDPTPPGPLPSLPGYCPGGTYHPASDPFACVPFPDAVRYPKANASAKKKAAQQESAAQKKQQQMQQPCPQGQARYPYTGKCVPLQCPQGTRRNPATGECLKTNVTGALPNCPKNYVYDLKAGKCIVPGSNPGGSDLWWALLIAGVTLFVAMRR